MKRTILALVAALVLACASTEVREALDWAFVVSDGIDIIDQLDKCDIPEVIGDDPIEAAIMLLDLLAETEAEADMAAVSKAASVVVIAHDDCVQTRFAAGEIDELERNESIRRSARFLRAVKRLEERYVSTE